MDDRNDIINLNQVRNRKQEEKQRKTERIFFHDLIGVYGVMTGDRLIPIELADVSEEGLGFQLPYREEKKWPLDMTDQRIRLYFSEESFMEVVVNIKNSRPVIDSGDRYVRYGAEIASDHKTYNAWKKFVGFLKAYADVSQRDSGNMGVSGF